MKVYFVNVADLTDRQLEECLESMSDERKTEISRLKNPLSVKQKTAGDYLTKKAISDFCGIQPEKICIKKDLNGKPYAENASVKFNVSHGEDLVVCAVSENDIGIDIEKIRDVKFRVAERFATEEERAYIGNDTDRFFEIWTLKEAYFKCIGTGLGADIRNVSFEIENQKIECSEKGFRCSFYPVSEGYCCSICEKISDAE